MKTKYIGIYTLLLFVVAVNITHHFIWRFLDKYPPIPPDCIYLDVIGVDYIQEYNSSLTVVTTSENKIFTVYGFIPKESGYYYREDTIYWKGPIKTCPEVKSVETTAIAQSLLVALLITLIGVPLTDKIVKIVKND